MANVLFYLFLFLYCVAFPTEQSENVSSNRPHKGKRLWYPHLSAAFYLPLVFQRQWPIGLFDFSKPTDCLPWASIDLSNIRIALPNWLESLRKRRRNKILLMMRLVRLGSRVGLDVDKNSRVQSSRSKGLNVSWHWLPFSNDRKVKGRLANWHLVQRLNQFRHLFNYAILFIFQLISHLFFTLFKLLLVLNDVVRNQTVKTARFFSGFVVPICYRSAISCTPVAVTCFFLFHLSVIIYFILFFSTFFFF